MSFCKNCGSMLSTNANFCHVCGAKVEVDDFFQKEEPKEEESKIEEPVFRSYYDEYNAHEDTTNNGFEEIPRKKYWIPGLISMIGSIGIGFEAFISYVIGAWIYRDSYLNNEIVGQEYIQKIKALLQTTANYCILSCLIGIVLGVVGILTAKRGSSKKGLIFSIVGVSVGVLALGAAIGLYVIKGMVQG